MIATSNGSLTTTVPSSHSSEFTVAVTATLYSPANTPCLTLKVPFSSISKLVSLSTEYVTPTFISLLSASVTIAVYVPTTAGNTEVYTVALSAPDTSTFFA